jgi:hypothetical protein
MFLTGLKAVLAGVAVPAYRQLAWASCSIPGARRQVMNLLLPLFVKNVRVIRRPGVAGPDPNKLQSRDAFP